MLRSKYISDFEKCLISYFFTKFLVVGDGGHVSLVSVDGVVDSLSAAIGQKDKVRSRGEGSVATLAVSVEVVALRVRHFPLVLISGGSNRLQISEITMLDCIFLECLWLRSAKFSHF